MYYFVLIPFSKVFSMSAYKATPPVQNDFSEKVWRAKLGQNDRQRSRLKLMLYHFSFIAVSFVVFYSPLVFIRRKFCDFNFFLHFYNNHEKINRFCFRNQNKKTANPSLRIPQTFLYAKTENLNERTSLETNHCSADHAETAELEERYAPNCLAYFPALLI